MLAFRQDFAVSFDTPLAERGARLTQGKRKVSGGYRSAGKADAFCALHCYIMN